MGLCSGEAQCREEDDFLTTAVGYWFGKEAAAESRKLGLGSATANVGVGAKEQIADYAKGAREVYDNPEAALEKVGQKVDAALSNIKKTAKLVSEDPGILVDAVGEAVKQGSAAADEAAALAVTDRDAFQQGLGRSGVRYVAGAVVRRGVAKAAAGAKKALGAAAGKVHGRGKLSPEPQAGAHTRFKTDKTGRVSGYTTYDEAGNPVKRFRGTGRAHGGMEPPIVYEPKPGKGPGSPLKVPRAPTSEELPKGY